MPINLLKYIINGGTTDNFREIMPSGSLVGYITGFYIFDPKDFMPSQPVFNEGLPTIVFMSDRESVAVLYDNGEKIEMKGGWINKGITEKVYIDTIFNTDYLLIIRFDPIAFNRFFETDPNIFGQTSISSFDDISEGKGRGLISCVFSEIGIDKKIEAAESYLKKYPAHKDYSPPLLTEALKFISEQKGNVAINTICKNIGVNYKWLECKFSDHIGLTPKQYTGLQRFIHAYSSFIEDPESDYFSPAVQNGYYDQSHFFKDFRFYIGLSPAKYIDSYNSISEKKEGSH